MSAAHGWDSGSTRRTAIEQRASLLESDSNRKRKRLANKISMDYSDFMLVYNWLENQLIAQVGSQVLLAYRCFSGRSMGRQNCSLGEDGYIICQSIDWVLDAIMDAIEDEDEAVQVLFASVWSQQRVYREVIDDVIIRARIDTFRHYGPLMKAGSEMVQKAGTSKSRDKRMFTYRSASCIIIDSRNEEFVPQLEPRRRQSIAVGPELTSKLFTKKIARPPSLLPQQRRTGANAPLSPPLFSFDPSDPTGGLSLFELAEMYQTSEETVWKEKTRKGSPKKGLSSHRHLRPNGRSCRAESLFSVQPQCRNRSKSRREIQCMGDSHHKVKGKKKRRKSPEETIELTISLERSDDARRAIVEVSVTIKSQLIGCLSEAFFDPSVDNWQFLDSPNDFLIDISDSISVNSKPVMLDNQRH